MYMRRKEYERRVRKCERIISPPSQELERLMADEFPLDVFPTIKELYEHKAVERFEDFFDYLLFYHSQDLGGFIRSEEKMIEYARTKAFLRDLFKESLIIVDEVDLKALDGLTYLEFMDMDDQEQLDVLEPLILCFRQEDFLDFAQMVMDMGITPFRKRTDVRGAKLNGKMPSKLEKLMNALHRAWSEIQGPQT